MRENALAKRPQVEGGSPDPVGERRAIEMDTLPLVNLRLAIERQVIGVEARSSGVTARVAGSAVGSLAQLSQALAVQVIEPGVHKLLEEGGHRRRRWMDWELAGSRLDLREIAAKPRAADQLDFREMPVSPAEGHSFHYCKTSR